ncbi:hypothetical protein [Streptomyces sp. NPDC051677]|uniref:hypothetical protein n=1 Tax=Streptomyces sp. NPDC051677 TaxID=3365669 RepID=UPI0037CE6553
MDANGVEGDPHGRLGGERLRHARLHPGRARRTALPGFGIAEDVAQGTLGAAPLSEPEVWRSVVLGAPRSGCPPPVTADPFLRGTPG